MTHAGAEAESRNFEGTGEEGQQNLPLADSIHATRCEVHAVGVQVAAIKEDLSRVAGQVARLHTLLARMAPQDGKKRLL